MCAEEAMMNGTVHIEFVPHQVRVLQVIWLLTAGATDEDVFRVRAPAEMLRLGPDRIDSQRVVLSRTRSCPLKDHGTVGLGSQEDDRVLERASTPRRWFSVLTCGDKHKDKDTQKDKDKRDGEEEKPLKRRGLNPDAKAFTFPASCQRSRSSGLGEP
jgi:hypothetical protein